LEEQDFACKPVSNKKKTQKPLLQIQDARQHKNIIYKNKNNNNL
jgi:hypothetical protein